MNLILIVLCGILMGAFNFAFFLFGFHVGKKEGEKQANENSVEVNEINKDMVKDIASWIGYGGK